MMMMAEYMASREQTSMPDQTDTDQTDTDQADLDVELDTMAMAREARKDQGSFECEVSYGGEGDLHRHWNSCEKNPGHYNFIPVNKFTKNHLPARYRDDDLFECILALAKLTVRIMCQFTSLKRPDTYPENDKQYPFYNHRGQKMLRCGTGWILHVNREPRPSSMQCPCQECRESQTPKSKFVEIEIRTAAHHIYDRFEAEQTICNLFFDEGGNPCKTGVKLTTGRIAHVQGDFEGDMCDLTYVTHDLDLAARLEQTVLQYESLHTKVKLKYPTNRNNADSGDSPTNQISGNIPTNQTDVEHCQSREENKLTVIISHPHGCSKQISVGEYVLVQTMDCRGSLTQYIYNTATCPGSSGAPVFVLDRDWLWLLCEHPHSGGYEDRNMLNYSGFALG